LKARVLTEQRPEFSLLETMRWTPEGGYFLFEKHLARLGDSADYFGYPIDVGIIAKQLSERAAEFSQPQRVRLLVDSKGAALIEATELAALWETPALSQNDA
jgi:para-aminobenzoate synthetase/4-amino-4-deoxychorismate lyase